MKKNKKIKNVDKYLINFLNYNNVFNLINKNKWICNMFSRMLYYTLNSLWIQNQGIEYWYWCNNKYCLLHS